MNSSSSCFSTSTGGTDRSEGCMSDAGAIHTPRNRWRPILAHIARNAPRPQRKRTGTSPFPFDQLFDSDHARAIVEFVTCWTDVDRIVVHCVGGVRRSPAVALAIAELLGQPTGELERQFPMWNTWVRREVG